MLDAASTLSLLPLPLLLTTAAITDFRRFVIPNWISLALIGGWLFSQGVSGLGWGALGEHALVGLSAFGLGFALFALGLWGGGDGKLFAAAALWFDAGSAPPFLAHTLLAGGALALAGLTLYSFRMQIWAFKPFRGLDLERLRTHAPYGVAIAIGALLSFPKTDLFLALGGM